MAARAVAAQPTASACEATVTNTFQNHPCLSSGLLDRNNDGTLDVVVTTATAGPPTPGK